MSTINFSSSLKPVLSTSSPLKQFKGLVNQHQLELVSTAAKVGETIPNGEVYSSLAISKDDSKLAFSTSEGKIEIWDVKMLY
jgi:hypothetical protein